MRKPEFTVACRSCPLRALKAFRKFTPEELAFVETFKAGEIAPRSGETIFIEGDSTDSLYTVLDGWVMKYKSLEDGRRQIINFAFPGDLVGLQGAVSGKMQHSVEVLSDARLCKFPKDRLWKLFEKHPGLAFDVTWLAAHEKSILADFLVTVGQRSASERVAFVLLHIFRRARMSGLVRKDTLDLPLTQEHLADTIGFSLVHTNRSVSRLRSRGVFEWRGSTFKMLDEDALAAFAGNPAQAAGPRPFI